MTKRERELVKAAMDALEEMPSGGVGRGFATEQNLDDAEVHGLLYDGDAFVHQSQRAWLLLQRALGREDAT